MTYEQFNAGAVLKQVEARITELEELIFERNTKYPWRKTPTFNMRDVYKELSIFDWWIETLSITRLKQMQGFLKLAISLGYTGYVCFKVGVAGCANGMWAYKEESTDGYSPDKRDFLYRSFTTNYTRYDIYADGVSIVKRAGLKYDDVKTSRQLVKLLRETEAVRG